MIDLTPIVNAVITLVALLITTFLLPWIKGKTDESKLLEIHRWATIAVEAAEMIYTESGLGEAKKKYVTEFLLSKGYKLDQDAIDKLIESVVFEVNSGTEAGDE